MPRLRAASPLTGGKVESICSTFLSDNVWCGGGRVARSVAWGGSGCGAKSGGQGRRAGCWRSGTSAGSTPGYVTSLLGSSMSTVAIAWAVLDSGEGATGLGYVFAAGVVPQVLVLPVAGAVADRLGRRRVMLAADVLRCAAQGVAGRGGVRRAARALAVRPAGLARGHRGGVLHPGPGRADGRDSAAATSSATRTRCTGWPRRRPGSPGPRWAGCWSPWPGRPWWWPRTRRPTR